MNGKGMGDKNDKKGLINAKPKNMWGTIKRLLGYMKKSSWLLVLTVIVQSREPSCRLLALRYWGMP